MGGPGPGPGPKLPWERGSVSESLVDLDPSAWHATAHPFLAKAISWRDEKTKVSKSRKNANGKQIRHFDLLIHNVLRGPYG